MHQQDMPDRDMEWRLWEQQASSPTIAASDRFGSAAEARAVVTSRSDFGATSSLPVALAKVRSQSDLPTFVIALSDGGLWSSRPTPWPAA